MAMLSAERAEGAPSGDLVAFFGRFKTDRRWALLIGVVNLLGIAYGFYYYVRQFGLTPLGFWAFVPDSPLAVLWAQLALLGWWALPVRRRGADAPRWLDALDGLAWVGNAQVGLWTVYVLVVYADSMGTWRLIEYPLGIAGPSLNAVLLVGHAAMAALGAIFLHGLRERVRARPARFLPALLAPLTYYLVNDVLDYWGPDYLGAGCGLRPITVPCEGALEPWLAGVTVGLTLLSTLVLALVIRPKRRGGRTAATD